MKTSKLKKTLLMLFVAAAVLIMLVSVMLGQEGKNKRKVNIPLRTKEDMLSAEG